MYSRLHRTPPRRKSGTDIRHETATDGSPPESEGARIVEMCRDARVPTIDGDMDRAANGDSLNASSQDRSVPGGSSDRVDHGFSIRGRTDRLRQTARSRFRDRSHLRAVRRARATPGLADRDGSSSSAAGLGPGLRPANPRQSRIAAVARFRRTGQAAIGRRESAMPASSRWTRNTAPRWATRCSGPSSCDARTERERRELETWTGEVSRKFRQGDHAWQGVRRP